MFPHAQHTHTHREDVVTLICVISQTGVYMAEGEDVMFCGYNSNRGGELTAMWCLDLVVRGALKSSV